MNLELISAFEDNCKVKISLFSKPTNSFQYLHFKSSHPRSIFKAFVLEELNRILLRSSDESAYLDSRAFFYARLLDRAYPDSFLIPLFDSHFSIDDRKHKSDYLRRRASFIQYRLQRKLLRSHDNSSPPLIYKRAVSASRINLANVLNTSCIDCAPEYMAFFNNRPPVISSSGYNHLGKFIISSKYQHAVL